jgi:hypothetical protein
MGRKVHSANFWSIEGCFKNDHTVHLPCGSGGCSSHYIGSRVLPRFKSSIWAQGFLSGKGIPCFVGNNWVTFLLPDGVGVGAGR